MENRRGTDGIKNLRGLVQVLGKYRYALIVLLVGAALMLLPSGRKLSETKAVTAPMQAEIPDVAAVQSELAALLSRVDGAGEVAVMLSLDYGPERFFQADEQKTADGERSECSSETVLYHESSAQRLPIVTKTRSPVYKGAVIVCEGAERPSVRLALVQAVSRLTGLGSDKISVMKMKRQ